jgi:hypothetical protein
MSPEPILLDEMPTGDEDDAVDFDVAAGKTACPECGNYFATKGGGLARHRRSAHGIEPERKQAATARSKAPALAAQWAEFQRGAALFVSFACTECAAVLVEDAETDGLAIANFCEGRPKLRKQIQQALGSMDVMILVGALGETARKMIAHHNIGKRIGLPGPSHSHTGQQSAQERMMNFLSQMPQDARNDLLNQVFSRAPQTTATATRPAAATPTVTVVMDDEPAPGEPPVPAPNTLTEHDRYQMAMANGAGMPADFATVGLGEQ